MGSKNTSSAEKAVNLLEYLDALSKETQVTVSQATAGYSLAQVHATLAVVEAIEKLTETIRIGTKY